MRVVKLRVLKIFQNKWVSLQLTDQLATLAAPVVFDANLTSALVKPILQTVATKIHIT
jgi:hypothetical protein